MSRGAATCAVACRRWISRASQVEVGGGVSVFAPARTVEALAISQNRGSAQASRASPRLYTAHLKYKPAAG